MNPFSYTRPDDVATALREIAAGNTGKFIAGGTNLLDLMKENVERPGRRNAQVVQAEAARILHGRREAAADDPDHPYSLASRPSL